ncbi:helix-turn-helix transcriptional regulator [Paenibacillus swuensis]|uniref:helix-turn-helix transcriptional regulator n=1 Tax=Paenibacillus swuensis TaxID=1178515 RepID=UPI000837FC1E|nr:AraC family transcriptional regulator [Paenibacillus swuensis]
MIQFPPISRAEALLAEDMLRRKMSQAFRIEFMFFAGQKSEFILWLQECTPAVQGVSWAIWTEWYYTIATPLLSIANRIHINRGSDSVVDSDTLMRITSHHSRDSALNYLSDYGAKLFTFRDLIHVTTDKDAELIARLHSYIASNLHADLSLSSLADIVRLNGSYLSRLYKSVTNQCLMHYITDERVKRSRALLRDNRLKVHEIAGKVGFLSPPYFTRFFKKETGMTPMEYRELVLNH